MNEVLKLQKDINKMQEKMKKIITNKIDKIEVEKKGTKISNNIMTIKFSELSKDYILSPSYYNIENQKELIKKKILSTNKDSIETLKDIINKKQCDNVRLNTDLLNGLEKILE